MGGRPVSALSIVGFPIDDIDGEIMERMLQGGIEKLTESGCSLIGGHSINDEEVKFGFAVTGLIAKEDLVERDKAQPGDALVLTKPLGTGMVAFATQIDRISQEYLEEVGNSMATLNKDAAELMVKYHANAATDNGLRVDGSSLRHGQGKRRIC
jgi:selenide,water dikinase